MRKIIISILLVMLLLCGCGSKKGTNENSDSSTETVEVDEGLIDVTITLPNSFFEYFDMTAEDYIESMESEETKSFKKVEKNDDGSVSITMSKKDYKELMKQITANLDDSLQEMVNSEDYSFESIEHDAKFEDFKVKLTTNEVGLVESFMVIAFSMYGGIYQLFDGNQNPHVAVKYIGADGNELMAWDSSEMQKEN